MLLGGKTGFRRGRSGPKTTVPRHEKYEGEEEVAVPVRNDNFLGGLPSAQPCRLGKKAGYKRQLKLSH